MAKEDVAGKTANNLKYRNNVAAKVQAGLDTLNNKNR
jgi:hypothetical protein